MDKKLAKRVHKEPRGILNERHRLVIDAYFANGFNKREAMEAGGYAPSSVDQADRVVFSNPDVIAEIQRRRDKVFQKADIDAEWVLRRYVALADAPVKLAKYKKINEDGSVYWDFTGATEDELALLSEVSSETYTDGKGGNTREVRKFKVTVPDAKAALDSIARFLGMFNDKLQIGAEQSLVDALGKAYSRVKK